MSISNKAHTCQPIFDAFDPLFSFADDSGFCEVPQLARPLARSYVCIPLIFLTVRLLQKPERPAKKASNPFLYTFSLHSLLQSKGRTFPLWPCTDSSLPMLPSTGYRDMIRLPHQYKTS